MDNNIMRSELLEIQKTNKVLLENLENDFLITLFSGKLELQVKNFISLISTKK